MLLAHKIALDPNNKQATYFARACGVARFAYNWALAEWKREFEAGGKPSDAALRKRLNAVKRDQFPWMFEVTKCAAQESIINLGVAFSNFFRDCKKPKAQGRARYPRPKKKGVHDSFCAANEAGTFRCDGTRIKLPVIGWVRMREPLRFAGKPKYVTISREADRWFASILVETAEAAKTQQPGVAVGVDLGIAAFATLSRPLAGEKAFKGPKAHKAQLARLRRYNKALARKKKGSANRRKARLRLARLHARIGDIRKDYLHKLSTALVKNYRIVGIEDLNVSGMSRNRCLARSIMDEGFRAFRVMLEYKAKLYGARVVVADRFYPSSKTCFCCKSVKQTLSLSKRTFACDDCGAKVDRDENAATNLEYLAVSSTVSACGEERSGAVRKSRVKRASAKQEDSCVSMREAA
jgi:putative transposase